MHSGKEHTELVAFVHQLELFQPFTTSHMLMKNIFREIGRFVLCN